MNLKLVLDWKDGRFVLNGESRNGQEESEVYHVYIYTIDIHVFAFFHITLIDILNYLIRFDTVL